MAFKYYIKNWAIVRQIEDVIPGPDTLATDLSQLIQELIDNQSIINLNLVDINILTENDTVVKARYAGIQPTAALSGDNDEVVTITIPDGCVPVGFKVEGLPENTDDQNRRTIVFQGAGLPGNTNTADIMIPGVIKAALTTTFGPPSADIPWTVDSGSAGDVEIVGIATTDTKSISLRVTGLNTLTDRHLIQFLW